MPDTPSSLSGLVAGHNRFGLGLFAAAVGKKESQNTVLSPTSLLFALGMAANAAAGATREEIASVLGLAGMSLEEANVGFEALRRSLLAPGSGVEIAAADSLWVSHRISLDPAFRDLCRQYFAAQVESVDFSHPLTLPAIVDWVRRETRGKIDLSNAPFRIDPETDLLLVDAIFFQGHWTKPFKPEQTREAEFTLPNGSRTAVPMMTRRGSLEALEQSDLQAVRLPYGKKDLRFVFEVYLPAKTKSLRRFIAELTADRWDSLGAAFEPASGSLALPRFAFSWDADLTEPLAALGMKTAFRLEEADFASMAPGPRFLSQVVHKARIEVDEQGTTAAAVTSGVAFSAISDFNMHVDRPFFWTIRDLATGAALFLGVVADPTAG